MKLSNIFSHIDKVISFRFILTVNPSTLALPDNQKYPLDPNGVPIKLGYRPPFNSESAKIAAQKSASVRRLLKHEHEIARQTLREIHRLLQRRKSKKSHPVSASTPASCPTSIEPLQPVWDQFRAVLAALGPGLNLTHTWLIIVLIPINPSELLN